MKHLLITTSAAVLLLEFLTDRTNNAIYLSIRATVPAKLLFGPVSIMR